MTKKSKLQKKLHKAQPTPLADETPVSTKAEDQGDHKPETIDVDKRSLKTFNTIFSRPSTAAKPGEVSWTDFLHAMTNAGFSSEKLGGSAWGFRPSSPIADRNIQFHEPHPSKKIPFRTARRIGRRLNRVFGWDIDIFRLRGCS